MTTIYKYPLKNGVTILELPFDAEILTVRYQDSEFGTGVMLYVQVSPKVKTVECKFMVIPTGGDIPEGATKYIGSVEVIGGLIFHIFQIFD